MMRGITRRAVRFVNLWFVVGAVCLPVHLASPAGPSVTSPEGGATVTPAPVDCVMGSLPSAQPLACEESTQLVRPILIPPSNGGAPCPLETPTVINGPCNCLSGACPTSQGLNLACGREVTVPRPTARAALYGGKECSGECVVVAPTCTPIVCPTAPACASSQDRVTATGSPCPSYSCVCRAPPTCAWNQNLVTTVSSPCPSYTCSCKPPPPCPANTYRVTVAASPCPLYRCQSCIDAARPKCYTAAGNYYAPQCTGYNLCGGCSSWWCYPRGKEYGNGCFPPGVKIRMASGDMIAVEDIRVGDMIVSPQTGEALRIASVIEGPEPLPLIHIIAGDLSVRVTEAHIVLTQEGLKRARDLTVHDSIVDEKGAYRAIDRIEPIPPEIGQRVINFVVEGFTPEVDKHLLISDGIVTGDLYLQNNLDSEQQNGDAD